MPWLTGRQGIIADLTDGFQRHLRSLGCAQTQTILSVVEDDRAYFDEISGKLDARFADRLRLPIRIGVDARA